MKKKRIPQDRSQPKKESNFFFSVIIGAIISLLSGTILLALSCIPALAMEDPTRFAPAFAIASLFLSTVLGSYLSARTHGKSGLACGALSSLLVVAVLVVLTLVLEWKIRTVLFAVCVPILVLCAMIAGVCGVSADKTARPKHKIKF